MEKDTRYQPLDKASISADQISRPSVSYWKDAWRRFRKDKLAVFGLIMILIVSLFAIFGPMLCPYAYDEADFLSIAQWPSKAHWFGTDALGRDLYVRVLYGARISLSIGVVAALVNMVIGVLYGGIAGYFGGVVDSVIMRTLDIFMSVPDILFTMAVVVALGSNFTNLLIALTLAYFTNYVRLVRSQVLNLSELEYVEAARAGGSGNVRIILSHIIPNAVGVIIVNVTLNIAKIIIYESTLSFLGLGMPPPQPEWGLMLSEAREFMRKAPFLLFYPALAIVLCACSVNLVGDGLRDALDPHLKS